MALVPRRAGEPASECPGTALGCIDLVDTRSIADKIHKLNTGPSFDQLLRVVSAVADPSVDSAK